MPSIKKRELKKSYTELLNQGSDVVMSTYTGLSVSEITDLRKKLREQGSVFKIVKNNIFQIAFKEKMGSSHENVVNEINENLKGPVAIAFSKDKTPGVAKVLRDYGKDNENVNIICGIMDSSFCSKIEVESIADLPSKEELLVILAASINSPASKIAGMMVQIMSSLARGIKAVGEKNS